MRSRFKKRRYRSGRPHKEDNTPPKKMLNEGRVGHFQYDVREALGRSRTLDEDNIIGLTQTIITKATRLGIVDAKEFVSEKFAEGEINEKDKEQIHRLLDRYAQYR